MLFKSKVFGFLKYLFVIIIFYFIINYILNSIDEINIKTFKINFFLISVSFLLLLIFLINQSLIWFVITKKNNCNISFSKTIISKIFSEFGKYIPGKIFGYVMIMYFYDKEKKEKKTVAFSMFFELVASILSSIFIFIFSLFFTNISLFGQYRFFSIFLLIFFFIIIHPKILQYFLNLMLKTIKKESVKFEISYIQILNIVCLYILNWFIFGISFMIFINSFHPLSFHYYFYVTGSTALAGIIGLCAIFVPAGLGVREGIITIALKEILPSFFAGIISITSRLWLTIGELFIFLIVFIYSKFKIK